MDNSYMCLCAAMLKRFGVHYIVQQCVWFTEAVAWCLSMLVLQFCRRSCLGSVSANAESTCRD